MRRVLLTTAGGADEFVTTTADGDDDTCDSHCTLREAVAAVADGDTIDLDAGTYTLTLGQLDLQGNFTIDGEGARSTTICSDGTERVGHVSGFTSVTLTELTVAGGVAGFDAELKLVEKLSCKPSGKKASAAAKRKRKRRLWGNGRGRFAPRAPTAARRCAAPSGSWRTRARARSRA